MLHSIGLGTRKLIFTSFPVGNIVPLKLEMLYFQVGNWEFCEQPDFRLGNTSREIRVSKPIGTPHESNRCGCIVDCLVVLCTDGMTALHQACCEGKDEFVQLLIHYGADVNIADVCGRTALHWACTMDSTQCLQVRFWTSVCDFI